MEPTPTAPRARHPRPEQGALAPELRSLVVRAARIENGLALLLGAPLECAAVLLGVSPQALELARAALESPPALAAATEAFERAAAARPATAGASGAAVTAPRGPEELIRVAQRRPDGVAILVSAAPESAAILFGVHPEAVLAARALAGQRGLSA